MLQPRATMYACHVVIHACWLVGLLTGSAIATPQQSEILATGLQQPVAIAIDPAIGQVLVAENGSGNVVRWTGDHLESVIAGFRNETGDSPNSHSVELLSLAFLDAEHLAVACRVAATGAAELRVYRVPEPGQPPIASRAMLGNPFPFPFPFPLIAESEVTQTVSLVTGNRGLFVLRQASGSCDRIGLAKFTSDFEFHGWEQDRIIAATEAESGFGSIGISPEGHLVTTCSRAPGRTGSQLLYYSESGMRLASYDVDLDAVIGLAYGPRRGRLFAITPVGPDARSGGLYKLVGSGNNGHCQAQSVLPLDNPRCMVFHPKGGLFIILNRSPAEDATPAEGTLIRIQGLDVEPDQ